MECESAIGSSQNKGRTTIFRRSNQTAEPIGSWKVLTARDRFDRVQRRFAWGQHLMLSQGGAGRRRAKFVYLRDPSDAPDAPPRLRQHARYDWDGERMSGERLFTRHPDAHPNLKDANAWTHTERLFAYHPGTFTPLAQITCHPHANGRVTLKHIHWCHTDQIGTPHALIDETGQRAWRIDLDAWGKRLEAPPTPDDPELAFTGATDPADCPIRLPGQFFDAETGLHYNRHRYYDPHAGRYVTQDPIGLAGGVNLYGYVEGKPTGLIDPNGLEVRVYSSDAFGVSGLNHSFVFSTELGMGRGRDGLSGMTWGDGVRSLDSPYTVAHLPSGLSEKEFMDRINSYSGWNMKMWTPWFNDCHTDLGNAFGSAGVSYPGAPNGRVDIDDDISRKANNLLFDIKSEILNLIRPRILR